ncbi:hypothetical protein WR25_05300 [Diploscapter pachys]|uniref:Signal recognition particle subunit SRP72 n=1 Tax=Diploscapter pachys TaxID=2018661 RepID=A0A2A2JCF4_9BILA|nr:hypothetical protein WR25_05300 [Diploscapter pachys]
MPSEASLADICQYLKDIRDGEAAEDFAKAIEAANKLIRRFPQETLAYKSKLVLLIRLNQWEDALSMINKCPGKKLGDCHFEKAYVLYRLGKLDESLTALEPLPKDDVRVKELKAQIFYKQDKFKESCDILQWMVKNHTDESDEERLANFQAVQKMIEAEKKQAEASSSEMDVDSGEKMLTRKEEKYLKKREARNANPKKEGEITKLKRRQRKRKILPKNYDPNVPPDPERWLPKHERTAYRKKNKKTRDREIGRGTQGSASANPNV